MPANRRLAATRERRDSGHGRFVAQHSVHVFQNGGRPATDAAFLSHARSIPRSATCVLNGRPPAGNTTANLNVYCAYKYPCYKNHGIDKPVGLFHYPAVTLFAQTAANEIPSLKNVPPIPDTPLSLYQKHLIELHTIETEFADAWRAVDAHKHKFKDGRAGWLGGKLFARVNALQYEPVLQSLESTLGEVSRRRVQLYAEHNRLKLAAGVK
jgi:hypothetical protein